MHPEVKEKVLRGNILASLQSFKLNILWNSDDVQAKTEEIMKLIKEQEDDKPEPNKNH